MRPHVRDYYSCSCAHAEPKRRARAPALTASRVRVRCELCDSRCSFHRSALSRGVGHIGPSPVGSVPTPPRAFFACRPALLSRPRDGRRSFLVASQRPTTREKAATRLLLKVPRAASRESTLEIWQRLRRPEMCRMSMLLKISVTRTQLQPEVCGMFKRVRSVVRSRPALPSLAPRVASPPFFQSCVLAHGLCRFRHP